jgi:L-alanine-DL-glutamate epimerase-like enolase superfamily enzyme
MIIGDAVEFTEVRLHENMLKAPHDALLALPLGDGCFGVPSGPGLGVEFDEQKAGVYRSQIVD